MNILDLFRKTPNEWRKRAEDITVDPKLKNYPVFMEGGKTPWLRLVFDIEGTTNNYKAEIEIPLAPKPLKNPAELVKSEARVYCSCPAFKYYVAYALNKNKALYDHKKELGVAYTQAPVERNPEMTPHVCKHLIGVINLLSNKPLRQLMKG